MRRHGRKPNRHPGYKSLGETIVEEFFYGAMWLWLFLSRRHRQ